MPQISLDALDAAELAELIRQWLTRDQARLSPSLEEFIGSPAYGVTQLREDLMRFST